jgi:hypothetical protein
VSEMDDVRGRLQRASWQVIAPDRPFERLIERRNRRRRGQRLASGALAFVITGAVVGGALLALSRMEKDPAGVAIGGLTLRPGEYFYLRIQSSEESDGHIRELETWWATDGSGEVRNRSTRQDKYPFPPSGTYGRGDFPTFIANVSELSVDPETLSRQLRDGPLTDWVGPDPEPLWLWKVITTILLEAPSAGPDLRAALFEVAQELPGVSTIEDTEDRLGRPALALEIRNDGGRWMMFFDPSAHQLIAWSFTYEGGPASWIVLDSGIVGAPGERPRGDDWLVAPLSRHSPR